MQAMKKVLIAVGALIGTLLALAVLIPLFINIDQYRPQILQVANDRLNGKLGMEKLSLSLWGQVKITIDKLDLQDATGKPVINVGQAYVHIPFSSVLSGDPHVTLRLDKPDIHVSKDAKGQMNLMTLMKPTPAGGSGAPAEKTSASSQGGGGFQDSKIFSLVFNAHADVAIEHGQLIYQDETLGLDQNLKDFNILLQDISMSRTMKLAIWSEVGTQFGESIKIQGPLRIEGQVTPKFAGVAFQNVSLDLTTIFDPLDIKVGTVLHKAAQVPANLKVVGELSSEQINLSQLEVRFHNAEIKGKLRLSELTAPTDQVAKPRLFLDMASNPISIKSWDTVILPLQGRELQGVMDLIAHAEGAFENLAYEARLGIKDFSAAVPGLPVKPVFQAQVVVVTDEVKDLTVDMNAPENHLAIKGHLKNFKAPQVALQVHSNGLNLDKILPPPAEPTGEQNKVGTKAGVPATTASTAPKEPGPDVDSMLEGIKGNEFIKSLQVQLGVDIKKFQGFKVRADNIQMDLAVRDLEAHLRKLALVVFKGQVGLDAKIDLKPKRPTYDMNLNLNDLDMQDAVTSQFESFRNTILGHLTLKASGRGESLNPDLILTNLDLKGTLSIRDATFATIDVGKMARDGVMNSAKDIEKKLSTVGIKVPPLKELPGKAVKYKTISSDFALLAGRFAAPNFRAESYPQAGLDLQGATELGLIDDSLSAEWFMVDSHNWLGLNEYNVKEHGVEIKKIFTEKGQPVRLPVKVGCKLSEPCFDYAAIPEHLGRVAMANVEQQFLKGARTKAQEEVQKKLDEARAQMEAKKKEVEATLKKHEDEQKRIAKQKLEEEKKKAGKEIGDKLKKDLKGKLPF